MDKDENDRSFLQCLKVHGYISSAETNSDEDYTKCELDELYEKYKPPLHKIDPAKYNLIIIDQSDEEHKFADENSVNRIRENKSLHSEILNQSSSKDVAYPRDINSDELLPSTSNLQQNWTKVSKRRKRRSKKNEITLQPVVLKSNEVQAISDSDKLLNLISDIDEAEKEEKCHPCDFKSTSDEESANIKINEMRKTYEYSKINEVTLKTVSCIKKSSESHQPHSSKLCLDDVANTKPVNDRDNRPTVKYKKSRTRATTKGNKRAEGSSEFDDRTPSTVINSNLSDNFVKKPKRNKKRTKKKKTQISEEKYELHLNNDSNAKNINTRNQEIEGFTYFTIENSEYGYVCYEYDHYVRGAATDTYLINGRPHTLFERHSDCFTDSDFSEALTDRLLNCTRAALFWFASQIVSEILDTIIN